MMTRADVVTRLRDLEPQLRAHGVASLFLYGSYARDEAGPSSDIDILADFGRGYELSLARFMNTFHALEDAFPGTEIGFGTRDSLVPVYTANRRQRRPDLLIGKAEPSPCAPSTYVGEYRRNSRDHRGSRQ